MPKRPQRDELLLEAKEVEREVKQRKAKEEQDEVKRQRKACEEALRAAAAREEWEEALRLEGEEEPRGAADSDQDEQLPQLLCPGPGLCGIDLDVMSQNVCVHCGGRFTYSFFYEHPTVRCPVSGERVHAWCVDPGVTPLSP